ncbi:MAG: glutamine--fructose-6-phosphate transaminase (isomerizing) [Gammaproteobacteria bacterium]
MCGIVGAIAQRNVEAILVAGLQRLEYRGYDSAGLALLENQQLQRRRAEGKVQGLLDVLAEKPIHGKCGIAQTRWATHGVPSERNAHPHFSQDEIAVVHNGIIENFVELRDKLRQAGYPFTSDTDSEVIPHLIHYYYAQHQDPLAAIRAAVAELKGAYALGIIFKNDPNRIWAVRYRIPLVAGLGFGENFFASDYLALLPVTQRFIYLSDGDIVEATCEKIQVYDKEGKLVQRSEHTLTANQDTLDKGQFRHFMAKEIFSQSEAIAATLAGRLGQTQVLPGLLGPHSEKVLENIQAVQIVACGTSYHAALVARYWIERYVRIPCQVEIASEYRYRSPVVSENTLFVVISQSGETADTLSALRLAHDLPYKGYLAICNVAESSIVREAQLVLLTQAGREIGVASTKAFSTQLVALALLMLLLGQRHQMTEQQRGMFINQLEGLPESLSEILALDNSIKNLAQKFADKQNALFLGRGILYPIALEGALKLKEISYVHAEAYPAGELKHGPLALVDRHMPIVAIVAYDELAEKVISNLQEVAARGGQLIIFADERLVQSHQLSNLSNATIIALPAIEGIAVPILFAVPLQLLAYHVAVLKGTDVDQPRNLAKSVTVE